MKKNIHSVFLILGALLGTLVTNVLCISLWSDYDTAGFFYTLFNKEASVDIGYIGQVTGGDAFDITTEPSLGDPQWIVDSQTVHRYTGNLKIGWNWEKYTITLNARRQGDIFINLRGPLKRNDYGESYRIFVDYRNLNIHDKVIFPGNRKLSHEKFFSYRIPVKKGEKVRILFEVRGHRINPEDFNLLELRNFWYVITLSIASFAAFYILLSGFSAFRGRGKAADAFFLFSFFCLLVVPMSNISDAQGRSLNQNRTLERRPRLASILQKNFDFGKQYERWFADHLAGRESLIDIHSFLRNHISTIIRTRTALYFKDTGQMFNVWALQLHKRDKIHPIVDNLTEFDRFLRANNVKLYILEAPCKEFVYKEQWQTCPLYDKSLGKEFESTHRTVRSILRNRGISCIFPYNELRDGAAMDYAYFKWGHHWTSWGAYLSYKALVKEMQKDFPDIPLQPIENFEKEYNIAIGDLFDDSYRISELPIFFNFDLDKSHIVKYTYYRHKYRDRLIKKYNKREGVKDFAFPFGRHKIMMIGTSCNEVLCNFIPYSAASMKYIRINGGVGGGGYIGAVAG